MDFPSEVPEGALSICLSVCLFLSLSLSLTHTHTHTHTLLPHCSLKQSKVEGKGQSLMLDCTELFSIQNMKLVVNTQECPICLRFHERVADEMVGSGKEQQGLHLSTPESSSSNTRPTLQMMSLRPTKSGQPTGWKFKGKTKIGGWWEMTKHMGMKFPRISRFRRMPLKTIVNRYNS